MQELYQKMQCDVNRLFAVREREDILLRAGIIHSALSLHAELPVFNKK
jgi:hypothetical protein